MASVSSTNSTTNSFFNTYGNANAITGLASGMDTEGMIEQAVSSFQKKIESLQQKQTLIQWKQTQLRSMITMLNGLNDNYVSYRSKTNLYSPAFFTSAKTYSAVGANADKIAILGGNDSSSVVINSVAKLATAATFRVDAGDVFGGADGTGEKINWDTFDLSTASSGRIFVTLDGVAKEIRIDDLAANLDSIKSTDKLAAALQKQLDSAFGAGRVTVENKDGALSFGGEKGSTLQVQSSVVKLGLGTGVRNYVDVNTTHVVDALCERDESGAYIYNGETYYKNDDGRLLNMAGRPLGLVINGVEIEVSTKDTVANLITKINQSGAGVTANYSQLTKQFTFTAEKIGSGSKIEFGGPLKNAFQPSNAPESMNAGSLFGDIPWDEEGKATVYIDGDPFELSKTDTMADMIKKIDDIYPGLIKYDSNSGTYGLYKRNGDPMDETDISLSVSGSDKEIALSDLIGKANSIKPDYTAGQDAELTVTINGVQTKLIRSSNTIDLEGMVVSLKGTFNVDEDGNAIEGEPVTFSSQVDAEKVVSAVRSFVEDFNAIIKAVREAYTTQPLEKSSSTHTKYEPLTDAEKEGLSDKTIAEYEEKAKTGLLFMDGDLSGLYSEMRSLIMANKEALAEIGISIGYDSESRSNFLELDEDKLATAMEGDVNRVVSVFTGEDGLMNGVQSIAKKYASTSYGDYGILVRKAGADESALSQKDSAYQKEIERLETQIDSWKSKLSAKVDYYSRQFSLLEQLMGTYNNQSSMLMSMMGY